MVIGHQILESKAVPYLRGLPCDALYFVLDSAVAETLPPLMRELIDAGASLTLPITSDEKDTATLAELWSWLHTAGASRESVLVIVGGGTLTDLAGFAAATYMRGIRTVNITTTLLGMVDASVGGKTAIDYCGVKNLIGAFHEPIEVFINTAFLDTLPLDELYSGFGEVIKTALLSGEDFWRKLVSLGDPQFFTDEDWLSIVTRCIDYKAEIVRQDPEERSGIRAVLNLGHTVAHALEAFARETAVGRRALLHGEAVVIGLVVEAYIAHKALGLDRGLLRSLLYYVREYYPHYMYVCKAYPRLIELMQADKKSSSGAIRFALLSSLGHAELWQTTDTKLIEEALDFYREAYGG